MACDLSLGRGTSCKDNRGGIKNIYFANNEDDLDTTATLDGDDQITAFATLVTLYKYEVRGDGNTFDEANAVDKTAGTSKWDQTLTVALQKLTVADNKELKLMSWGNPQIVIEDYNGNFRIAGFENGCDVAVSTASGGNMAEFSGYNLEATGEEVAPANFIDPTIIGDDVNTTVVTAA